MSSIINFIDFEPKPNCLCHGGSENCTSENKAPMEIKAFLNNTELVIKDVREARWLYLNGNFGSLIGHRMNFVNKNCFSSSVDSEGNKDITQEPEKAWICSKYSNDWLFISLIEALYLLEQKTVNGVGETENVLCNVEFKIEGFPDADSFCNYIRTMVFRNIRSDFEFFLKRYATYRHFRKNGWIVRDGIFFGVDFLLYKSSVTLFHSSAAVRIFTANSIYFFDALRRELVSCKKTLLLMDVKFTRDFRIYESSLNSSNRFEDILDSMKLEVILSDKWKWNYSRLKDFECAAV